MTKKMYLANIFIMLPLQGERNNITSFHAQGVAIGLGYAAPSGRKCGKPIDSPRWCGLKVQHILARGNTPGIELMGAYALKGQHSHANPFFVMYSEYYRERAFEWAATRFVALRYL